MASRGRGRRERPRDTGQAPPGFDQQAFVEAVGNAVAAIAQADIAGSQGGPSNLQRFLGASSSDIYRGRRSDGGRPLVYADREGVRGHGDYLLHDQDQVSCVPARG